MWGPQNAPATAHTGETTTANTAAAAAVREQCFAASPEQLQLLQQLWGVCRYELHEKGEQGDVAIGGEELQAGLHQHHAFADLLRMEGAM